MGDSFTEIEQAACGGFPGVYAQINHVIEEDLLSHSHITHVEFEVLLRLSSNENHPVCIKDVAAENILTHSGVSRMVERLEKAGLVTREEAAEDRRGAFAVLSEAGVARFEKVFKAHVVFVREKFLSHYSEKELKQMAVFWRRLENKG